MALPSTLLDEIKDLKRRVADLERYPQPPNINISGVGATASFSLNPAGTSGDMIHWDIILSEDNQANLLAVPQVDLYKDEINVWNGIYSYGANWTQQLKQAIEISVWAAQKAENWKTYVSVLVKNNSSNTVTGLYLYGNFRYITQGASL